MAFTIDTEKIGHVGVAVTVNAKSLQSANAQVASIASRLAIHGAGSSTVRSSLRTIAQQFENESRSTKNLGQTLVTINNTYANAEKILTFDAKKDTFKWSNYWKVIGEVGIIGAVISTVGSIITGKWSGTTGFDTLKFAAKAIGGIAKAVSKGSKAKWGEALWGLSQPIKDVANFTGKGGYFVKSLTKQFTQDLGIGKGNVPTTNAGKVAVASKWAGHILTVAKNGFENFNEFKGTGNWGRGISETVIESAVDIGLGAVATAGVTAALGALGFVSAPALVVGGLATAAVVGANALCKWATGGRDIGEVVADAVCDTAEAAVKVGKSAVKAAGKAVKNAGKAVSAAWSGATKMLSWAH